PGEIRFNEDRTAHIVPRLPGIVDSVPANLGQAVKQGELLAVISRRTPSRASRRAMAKPMPSSLPAPLMSAT
ncbi:hypothetical protein, partial [Escherichia coli]